MFKRLKFNSIALRKYSSNVKRWPLTLSLFYSDLIINLFRMGIFGAAHGWGRAKSPPPSSLKSVTQILQWWNLAIIPYLKKIQKIYESRDTRKVMKKKKIGKKKKQKLIIKKNNNIPWVQLTSAFFHQKSANFVISKNTDIDFILGLLKIFF